MNKKILLKTATITVPLLTLGILVGSAASAATAAGTTNADAAANAPKQAFFRHFDMKRGKMDGTNVQKHKDVQTAIENNDYAKFKELTSDAPFADKVNETSFAKLVEAHKLMTQAQTLLQESGIGMPFGHPGKGMKPFNAPTGAPAETP